MDLIKAIKSRKSIRGFKPDPIPQATLRQVLELAVQAPSAGNTQPWEFTVVNSPTLDNIRQGIIESLSNRVRPNPDIRLSAFGGVYGERQARVHSLLYRALGIPAEDRARKREWAQFSFLLYDAPACIYVCWDAALAEAGAQFDAGCVSQTICLAALNFGLGTCIDFQAVCFPDVIRLHTGIPPAKKIAMAIAIGYPDPDSPANNVDSEREPLEQTVSWCGF